MARGKNEQLKRLLNSPAADLRLLQLASINDILRGTRSNTNVDPSSAQKIWSVWCPKIQCPGILFANSETSKLQQFFARTEMAHIGILVGQPLLEMPKNGINQLI
jgi:hypothetical protein